MPYRLSMAQLFDGQKALAQSTQFPPVPPARISLGKFLVVLPQFQRVMAQQP
jgi:hypothetical protein